MFATGSNNKVWVGDAGGVKIFADNFFVDVLGFYAKRNDFLDGSGDLVSTAIVKGEGGGDGVIAGRLSNQIEGFLGNIFGKFINVAQKSKPSSFADELDGKRIKPDTKDIKQLLDFCLIALPVFGRKSPKSNIGDF